VRCVCSQNPHNLLGGHIRSFSSPADPLFFSHHAFIDKLWDMWQNCHNYDVLTEAERGDTQYEYRQSADFDGVDADLVFNYPQSASSSESTCFDTGVDTSSQSTCEACVEGRDTWCASNAWDNQCEGFCVSDCSADCAGGLTGASEGTVSTQEVPTWDTATTTVNDFYSVHDIGGTDRAYLYAPDQLDSVISVNDAICDMSETAHHAQTWKRKRRALSIEELQRTRKLVGKPSSKQRARRELTQQQQRQRATKKGGAAAKKRDETGRRLEEYGYSYDDDAIQGDDLCWDAVDGSWGSTAVYADDVGMWLCEVTTSR